MTDAVAEAPPEAAKTSKMPLVLGLVAALIGGGGGFYAAFSGMILAPDSVEQESGSDEAPDA